MPLLMEVISGKQQTRVKILRAPGNKENVENREHIKSFFFYFGGTVEKNVVFSSKTFLWEQGKRSNNQYLS